ncbi:polynucleotide 5'-hydroxyl-kinase nol9-like isoform X2 [Lycorma delicatula]|uniref:polynucleotide 5'-hydroxyl-kinase nol9-like isoform X2 n=1 Tax=Lycorma delicatula TaxID=130591 RepID=UPI003F519912
MQLHTKIWRKTCCTEDRKVTCTITNPSRSLTENHITSLADGTYRIGCYTPFEEGSRTILCGGSGVGKSTLLRYLVNRSLSSWDKVLVIDFDPGQSEFTVPGCVSAFLINTPLLGPNFTHISNPLRSFFYGSVDVIHNLKFYFICIQNVIDY